MKATHQLCLVSLATASLANAASLVHRYSFDDGAELTDSVSGNTGVLNNGATVSGGTLVLTGQGTGTGGNHMGFTSPVDIGANFGASGLTLESWYTDTGTGTWGKLFHFGTNVGGQEFGYTHMRGSNGNPSGIDREGAKTFPTISLNTEHHLAITLSGDGNMNAWIDGVMVIENSDTNDLSNIGTTFEGIGATNWGDPGMTGNVNEFRLWSEELSAAQVATNFAAGADTVGVPEPSGLLLALTGGLLAFRRRRA